MLILIVFSYCAFIFIVRFIFSHSEANWVFLTLLRLFCRFIYGNHLYSPLPDVLICSLNSTILVINNDIFDIPFFIILKKHFGWYLKVLLRKNNRQIFVSPNIQLAWWRRQSEIRTTFNFVKIYMILSHVDPYWWILAIDWAYPKLSFGVVSPCIEFHFWQTLMFRQCKHMASSTRDLSYSSKIWNFLKFHNYSSSPLFAKT